MILNSIQKKSIRFRIKYEYLGWYQFNTRSRIIDYPSNSILGLKIHITRSVITVILTIND